MPLQQDYNKTSTLLLTKIFNEISLSQSFKSGEFSQTLDCVYFLALMFLLWHHSIYSDIAIKWSPTANPPGKMGLYKLLLEESSEFEDSHIVLSRIGIQDQGL